MIIAVTAMPGVGSRTFCEFFSQWKQYMSFEIISINDAVIGFISSRVITNPPEAAWSDDMVVRSFRYASQYKDGDPHFWIDYIRSDIATALTTNDVVIIPDVISQAEIDYVQAAGGFVVHLTRKDVSTYTSTPIHQYCFENADYFMDINTLPLSCSITYENYVKYNISQLQGFSRYMENH